VALVWAVAPVAEAQPPIRITQTRQVCDVRLERAPWLPVVRSINLKTAKALGLTIPPSLLLRADKVIP